MFTAPVPYDPHWPALFQTLRTTLITAHAPTGWQIAHIGSTAVPGLSAKPIIDMQIGVAALDDLDTTPITDAGFVLAPEITRDDPIPGGPNNASEWRKLYARRFTGGTRIAHLHIREIGRANHRTALLVRDYLRISAESAALYAQMKQQAARAGAHASDPGGGGAYSDIKDPFVRLLALRAQDWAHVSGWVCPAS